MAAGDSYRYSLGEVDASLDGAGLAGAGPDSFVGIQYDEPAYTPQTGATGEKTVSRNLGDGGTVRITLMQTARVSIEIAEAARLRGERGVGPSTITVETPTESIVCSGCWPTDRPQYNYNKAAGPREFVWSASKILRTPKVI